MDNRGSRVRFSAEAVNFSLHHRVQIGSGTHLASYPMSTLSLFLLEHHAMKAYGGSEL
jgi:hypothetical protein